MTGRYQAYPDYKASGVEWLEEVPSHWNSKLLKFLCTHNDEVINETTDPDYEIEYVDIGSVSAAEGISGTERLRFGKSPSRARRIVRDGDVIVSTVRTYLEAITPITNPPENMVVSTGFAVIRPNGQLYNGFAAYCLRAKGFIKEVIARSVGVSYPAINASDLVDIKVPALPYDEQKMIANFLDHETAKIDSLIAKQEKLIELLKEKRQAIISYAVTKGLNPDSPMKDSDVEWLGQVPEHWKVVKCAYLGRLFGSEAINEELIQDNGDIPFIKVSSLSIDSFYLAEKSFFVSSSEVSALKCKSDYVVFPKRGAAIFTNKVNIVKEESLIDPNLMGWKLNSKVLPEYVAYILKLRGLGDIADVSTVPQINNKHIEPMKFPLPPMEEQREILASLKNEIANFESLTGKANSAIGFMKERKTALISAAVTGKIDVRDWQVA